MMNRVDLNFDPVGFNEKVCGICTAHVIPVANVL